MTDENTPLNDEVIEDEQVEDEAESDETVPSVSYDVTSYGSDPDVEGLVRRLKRGDILVPPFQRDYVWHQPEASRFVESLLLGLPVPGIFLSTESETNKLLVIDGQQRLKSLQFYYEGFFNPKPEERRPRVFQLVKVQKPYEGKTYKELDEKDRIRLDNAVIHATVVKQTSPPGDDTSLFHIFERLNSGGRRLAAQEMRVAIYHGTTMDLVKELNKYSAWRSIYGKINKRLKDQELILRFFALYYRREKYARPMGEFINKFAGSTRKLEKTQIDEFSQLFISCCDIFEKALGKNAFRPTRAINVAVFDSCMVGLAHRITTGAPIDIEKVKTKYEELINMPKYVEAVSSATADEAFVDRRISLAISLFSTI